MNDETKWALDISGLHAHYGQSHVLHGVNLRVPEGSIVGLVGRNGVGKTTTVNAVMGIVPVTEGQVRVFGEDVTSVAAHKMAKMGVRLVPQGRRLFPSVTVREHLAIAAQSGGKARSLEWAYERFPALRERASALSRTLSGGEQSQLAIARAVIAEPRLVLMDEPTEGLAPLMVEEVGRLIRLLRDEGSSVLLVEQNLRFALKHCDQLAVMSRGEIVHLERVADIEDSKEFVSTFMGIATVTDVA